MTMDDANCSLCIDEAVGLLMTFRCNLNCKYCYIHTKREKDISKEERRSV